MRIYAIANQKGGAGKSGTTVCLAGALVDMGKRVLVVDLEPQATATEWLGARPVASLATARQELEDTYGPALLSALLDGKALPVYDTPSGVAIAPSGNAMNSFEIEAARLAPGQRELLLRRSISELAALWDYVFIDCPPSLGLTTINALAAADRVIMPVRLHSASRTPLVRLFLAAQEVADAFNPGLDLLGIVGTFHRKNLNHSADMIDWLRGTFPADIPFKTVIRDLTHTAESHAHQKPVTQYVRDADLRGSLAVEDFQALAREFIERDEAIDLDRDTDNNPAEEETPDDA